jgi:transcriptional regulator with XRE-family HTH domain
MHKRLSSLIKALGLSAAQFADEIGVQRSSISHVISGRNKPSMDFIEKILQRFPRVNADWLIMGSGSVFRDEDLFSTQEKSILRPSHPEKSDQEEAQPEEKAVRKNNGADIPEKERATNPAESNAPAVDAGDGHRQIKELIIVYSDSTFKLLKPEKPIL